jgi:hypothetical protein
MGTCYNHRASYSIHFAFDIQRYPPLEEKQKGQKRKSTLYSGSFHIFLYIHGLIYRTGGTA